MRRIVLLSALAAVMAVVLASPAQGAATLTVTTLADEQNNNGSCSLREAIINANENNQTGSTDCAAGSGDDTITFTVSGQITLNTSLPQITDPAGLTISNPIGPITEAVTISGNNANTLFFIQGAELTLDNLILSDASSGNGAIFSAVSTLTITNSIVSGNSGGNAINNQDTLMVTNSIFSGNSGGGAIGNQGTLTVTNSTFSGNSHNDPLGGAQGGAIASVGTVNVSSTTFTGNSTSGSGGAIHNLGGGSLTVNNSTFSGNTAPDGRGGGIFCETGSFAGTHDTFTNNSGGNLVLENCSLELSNTILANDNQGSNCSEPITDGAYNISDDASCAFSASTSKNSTNPRVHPQGLRNNGGPTHTIALLPNSPAIDAIPRAINGCGTDVETDQRGLLRPQGPACDIGAFEVQKKTPTEPPPDKRSCRKGGWKEFGFKNQGQCIKAVNQAS